MLGTEVRRLRKCQGLSQTALAKKLRKSRSWVCKIESGNLRPSLDAARALIHVLPLDPKVIFCDPDEEEGRAMSTPCASVRSQVAPKDETP